MSFFRAVCFLGILLVGFMSSQPLMAATLAHWRFESGALLTDSGPNSYHLTGSLGTAPTATLLPTTGNGSQFRGVIPQTGQNNLGAASFTSGAFVSNHPSGNAAWNDTSFTAEAYFNLSATNGIRSIVGQLGSARRWLTVVNDGALALILNGSDGINPIEEKFYSVPLAGMRGLTANTDYYMAMSVDLTNPEPTQRIQFYLKNLTAGGPLLQASVTTPFTSLRSSTSPISIGATSNPSSQFSGIIDEVRLSDHVLNVSELLIAPEPGRALFCLMGGFLLLINHRRRATH